MRRPRLISVIVPAYKQARTIKKDLENIERVLKQGLKNFDYEIICVVDGSPDQTWQEANKAKSAKVKVVGYQTNKGKGYAVRFGMTRSKGELISFLDAGMEISPASIMMLMAHLDWYKADVIVGSKRHPVSRVNYPALRHLLSIGYHFLVKLLFGIKITDTQSGIKIFRREVIEKIIPRLLVKKYAMDIEMLAVARHLGYRRIFEAPIEVTFDRTTSSINWQVVLKMLWDSLTVYYRLKIRGYYHYRNRKRWVFDPELKLKIS